MESSFLSFITSDQIRIEGPNGKTFYIHSALAAKQSKVLRAAMNSNMKEATDRVVNMMDVDDDINDATVACFIEFAYRGDYSLETYLEAMRTTQNKKQNFESEYDNPTPSTAIEFSGNTMAAQSKDKRISSSSKTTTTASPASTDRTVSRELTRGNKSRADASSSRPNRMPPGTTPENNKNKSLTQSPSTTSNATSVTSESDPWISRPTTEFKPSSSKDVTLVPKPTPSPISRETLWETFKSQAHPQTPPTWKPRPAIGTGDLYTADLLCHARLYIFSLRYQCASLADLTLQKLRLTLAALELTPFRPFRSLAVIDLARYAYGHTMDHRFGCDRLRGLVVDYVVCHLERVVAFKEFKELMRMEGGFGCDLLLKAMVRVG